MEVLFAMPLLLRHLDAQKEYGEVIHQLALGLYGAIMVRARAVAWCRRDDVIAWGLPSTTTGIQGKGVRHSSWKGSQ